MTHTHFHPESSHVVRVIWRDHSFFSTRLRALFVDNYHAMEQTHWKLIVQLLVYAPESRLNVLYFCCARFFPPFRVRRLVGAFFFRRWHASSSPGIKMKVTTTAFFWEGWALQWSFQARHAFRRFGIAERTMRGSGLDRMMMIRLNCNCIPRPGSGQVYQGWKSRMFSMHSSQPTSCLIR